MEEAYTALYQEFLRLQSLCLKQAAMLQHLTEALRRQQGLAPVSNADLEGLGSVPVLCNYDGLGAAARPEDNAQGGRVSLDTEINPIIGGMDRLYVHPRPSDLTQNQHNGTESVTSQQQAVEHNIWDELRQAEQRYHSSQAAQRLQRPWASSFMNSEMLSQAGGLLMSRVTLQSQVCEFCHAVFPGHTTTQGEFLRHLNTHIS